MELLRAFIIPIVTSMVVFLITTVWYQGRKEKRQDKIRLLLILMGSFEYLGKEETAAFYTIPIVFHESGNVLEKWESCKEIVGNASSLSTKRGTSFDACENTRKVFPELIEAMAKDLKYNEITVDKIKRIKFKNANGE